jgi:hypothetical protein
MIEAIRQAVGLTLSRLELLGYALALLALSSLLLVYLRAYFAATADEERELADLRDRRRG